MEASKYQFVTYQKHIMNIPNKLALNPLGDYIVMDEIAPPDQTDGGIIVPEAHKRPLNQGRVIDKGPLVSDRIKPNIEQVCIFSLHSESRTTFCGRRLIFVQEANVIATIEPASPTPNDNATA